MKKAARKSRLMNWMEFSSNHPNTPETESQHSPFYTASSKPQKAGSKANSIHMRHKTGCGITPLG